jgi:hypothetical protein
VRVGHRQVPMQNPLQEIAGGFLFQFPTSHAARTDPTTSAKPIALGVSLCFEEAGGGS